MKLAALCKATDYKRFNVKLAPVICFRRGMIKSTVLLLLILLLVTFVIFSIHGALLRKCVCNEVSRINTDNDLLLHCEP